MTSRRPKTAREIATAVLNQFDPKLNYAGPILNKLLDKTTERQRATDLVFGSVRNRTAIDMAITKFADCPVERIRPKLLNIIRVASFELVYSPQTGEHAIVNEAVENAKALAGKKQTGFVNAVLRQIARHITNRQVPLSEADAKRTLPQTPATGCEFDTDILPDPKASPAQYFSTAFSLPKWLVTDWLKEFGAEQVRQICFASNRRPSIYIRPNTLKTTTQELAEKFCQANIDFEIVPDESMVKIKAPRAVTELPGFSEGLFSVQGIAASQAVRLLQPQPERTILDLCAAPGTKTTQLAELTADSAKIIATDIDSERLKKIKENTARLGIHSVSIIPYEQVEHKAAEIGPFDAVLLDVPCSNTGVLAKRIEARYRIKSKAIKDLTKLQSELLKTAVEMLKPQGRIAYSTCSIQKQENYELVRAFLLENKNFKLESEKLILPSPESSDHDGGYVAIITRK
ncbi:MAG: 16S rRNA (cytosine(967)-C(5))-methyltransferase RsmB [Planctomycetota bacterium]|jgi:16S rRNA (cytosine967-C5)-methyltransferase